MSYLAGIGGGGETSDALDRAYALIGDHERSLARGFLDGIASLAGIRLHGPASVEDRVCTFGLTIEGVSPQDAARELDARGIFAWNGNFYAQGVMQSLGVPLEDGILRLGFAHYATHDEIDRCISALADIAGVPS